MVLRKRSRTYRQAMKTGGMANARYVNHKMYWTLTNKKGKRIARVKSWIDRGKSGKLKGHSKIIG